MKFGVDLKERERILKVHAFLPGREAILKSMADTRARGWLTISSKIEDYKKLLGKKGKILQVHSGVVEAVKVDIEGNASYWSYKDLILLEDDVEELEPRMFHFDVSLLNTGV
jgi:predicted RNA-binding protein YlqC (UPF0109 family)